MSSKRAHSQKPQKTLETETAQENNGADGLLFFFCFCAESLFLTLRVYKYRSSHRVIHYTASNNNNVCVQYNNNLINPIRFFCKCAPASRGGRLIYMQAITLQFVHFYSHGENDVCGLFVFYSIVWVDATFAKRTTIEQRMYVYLNDQTLLISICRKWSAHDSAIERGKNKKTTCVQLFAGNRTSVGKWHCLQFSRNIHAYHYPCCGSFDASRSVNHSTRPLHITLHAFRKFDGNISGTIQH